ncbi:hypothetical protein [Vagococcus fluvialis]|uniref:hypothetical protein n=1 Tax=Vagococcus fluvialis TaxID=2738 RepID=UPI00378C3B91
MRIDDENKVVWCSDWLIERLERANFTAKNGLGKVKILSEQTLSGHVPESCEDDKWKRLIDAVYNNYTFKLEEQKYYWRKKKEYLAWFEKQENCYLSKDFIGRIKLSNLDDEGAYKYFKFTEDFAHDLLKDDFDKFEKVECE